jgi:hypothetical protein
MRTTRRVMATLVLTLPLSLPAANHAQQGQVGGQVVGLPQQPPRDAPPPQTGTAVISGVVTAADTGLPLWRAVVTLMPGGVGGAAARSAMTDLAGRFELTGVPAGTHTLRAEPGGFRGQYVGASFGAKPGEMGGKQIVVAEGQRFDDAHIMLPRGGAIEGRVLDEFGGPIARASVYAARVMGGGSSFARTGPSAQTDDQGRFRLFGLQPAEYIVAAETRNMGGRPVTDGDTEGFAVTYLPSTLVDREAARVRITFGTEVRDLQIQLVRTRTFRVTGTVIDSQGRAVSRPNAMLVRTTSGGSSGSGFSIEPTGRFTIRDVLPGEYRLVVRPSPMGAPPGSPSAAPATAEYASVPLHVYADVDDLVVVTSRAVSVAGSVTFSDGAPLQLPRGLRIIAQPDDRTSMFGPPPSTTVDDEMQFTLENLFGPVVVRPQGVPAGYALLSVRVGSHDITDEPFEFKASHSGQVQVMLTNRVGSLEGVVTDSDGAPARGAVVLVIPDDKALWKMGSSRMHTTGLRGEGRFSVTGLLPGSYHVVAVQGFSPGPNPAPEFFEALVEAGTRVQIAEGERRTLDLFLVSEAGR